MSTAERYRTIAADLRAKALKAPDDAGAGRYDSLARAYLRLADQAEQNERMDVWAEFGPKHGLGGG